MGSSMFGKVLVIGGKRGYRKYPDTHGLFPHTNSVEAWVFTLKGDYWGGSKAPPMSVIRRYDLVVANLNWWLVPQYAALMERRPPSVRWVSLIDGGGEDYLSPSPELIRVLQASDLVATINQYTTDYFRHLARTRVEWVGIPYPHEFVCQLATPPASRRREVLACTYTSRNNRIYPRGMGHYASLVVAQALGVPVRLYVPKVSRTLQNFLLFLRHRDFGKDLYMRLWERRLSSRNVRLMLMKSYSEFWQEAGECYLWINLDPRYTWARYVLDAAALGVPIISTSNTAHAPFLFPETTVEHVFCVEQAIEIAKRLLSDEDFLNRVILTAGEKMSLFTPEACVDRLASALEGDKGQAEKENLCK